MSLAAAESRFVQTLAAHLQLSADDVLDRLQEASETVLVNGRFTALSFGRISGELRTLSFEGLDALTTLDISGCGLSNLDLAELPRLAQLDASNNALTHLELSHAPSLRQLNLAGNNLMVLDLRANPALTACDCSGNALTALMMPVDSQLVELRASRNQLMVLDVPHSPKLTTLACAHNALVRLTISAPALVELDARANELADLDTSDWPVLDVIRVDQNRLGSLDVQKNHRLTTLSACGNYLDEVNFEGLDGLRRVDLSRNQLPQLTLHSASLTHLNCAQNRLTQLDLAAPQMMTLHAASNGLPQIDLTALPALCCLDLRDNALKGLATPKALARLQVDGNPLTHLNIEGSPRLAQLSFDGQPAVMASPTQRRQIPSLQGEQPDSLDAMNRFQAHTFAATLTGPERERQLLALIHAPERCARGTAVMIYWMTSPAFYLQFEARESVPAFALAGWDLLRAIETQMRGCAYPHDDVLFDPTHDQQTVDPTGKNWTAELPPEHREPELCRPWG